LKYSKDWVLPLTRTEQYCDAKILDLIDVKPPPKQEVYDELSMIASEFKVAYESPQEKKTEKKASNDDRLVVHSLPTEEFKLEQEFPPSYEEGPAPKKRGSKPASVPDVPVAEPNGKNIVSSCS
jgi:hypothetical protein